MQKQKSDMELLKEQNQKDMKEQEKQIENRIKAKVDLYKIDMDAMTEQNKKMRDKIEQLDHDMEEKNHEIRRIKVFFFVSVLLRLNLFCFVLLFSWVVFDASFFKSKHFRNHVKRIETKLEATLEC